MTKLSAGILLFRFEDGEPHVLLVHPGGPFWKNKDQGAWSIPKGEYVAREDALAAAKREFEEELGAPRPEGTYVPLGDLRQSSGKLVTAFAIEGDFNPALLNSNSFEIEWPPRSGKRTAFPEVDKAHWFSLGEARIKILASQLPFIERLEKLLTLESGTLD